MVCKVCSSGNQIQLKSEMCLHQPSGFNRPELFIFPKVSICLQCGFTEFRLSDEDLLQVRKGDAQQDDRLAS
jgi:hypothetical protein